MVCANENHNAQDCNASTSQDVANDNNESETTETETETTDAVDANGESPNVNGEAQDTNEESNADRESRDENEESRIAEDSAVINGDNSDATEESRITNGENQDASADNAENGIDGERNGEIEEVDEERLEVTELTDALTFDENHFSTPLGGASPVTSQRSRRPTTSSMDDSEVRGDAKCKYSVHKCRLVTVERVLAKKSHSNLNVVTFEIKSRIV